MALYFKLTTRDRSDIINQSNDKRNKKIAASLIHSYKLEFDSVAGHEVNTLFQVSSIELNADLFTLNNIILKREQSFAVIKGVAGGVTQVDGLLYPLMPRHFHTFLVGVSDNDCSQVTSRDEFLKCQKVSYPICYNTSFNQMDMMIQLIDKKCAFETKKTYLNVFTDIATVQTGDITDFVTYTTDALTLALLGAGYTLDSVYMSDAFFIDGLVE
jgi:hypothetical protein